MKRLIKKILKEEFINHEVNSTEINICDIMSANTWDEIEDLLDKMEYDNKFQPQIDKIRSKMQKDLDALGSDKDVVNTYLRHIQNIVCK
jgi:hypothetical protein